MPCGSGNVKFSWRRNNDVHAQEQRRLLSFHDGVIESVTVVGGCNGNLKGISALLTGLRAEDAIRRLKGLTCGSKHTSCPDQIALALEEALAK